MVAQESVLKCLVGKKVVTIVVGLLNREERAEGVRATQRQPNSGVMGRLRCREVRQRT